MRERIWAASFAPPTDEKTGDFPPVFIQFWVPLRGIKNATGLCYLWRCPGRCPVCIQLYGQGEQAPLDRLCIHISAFRGLSACQGSLNSSKIVVNEMVLTCLKCPWIQCFQGIIRFRLDFSPKKPKKGTAPQLSFCNSPSFFGGSAQSSASAMKPPPTTASPS